MNWLWGKKEVPKTVDEFDPDALPIEKVNENQLITSLDSDYKDFISPIENFKPGPQVPEERHPNANKSGGKNCGDKTQVNKIRQIGKQVIKQIGKKLISGDLNLTRISFPIKAMFPKTALQSSLTTTFLFPLYINKACTLKEPVQRFRLVVTALISYFYYLNMFLKPLNPILGQTLEASYPDGTMMFLQQISHHPPVSYFYVLGPQNSYKFYGYYLFEARAGLNSMTLSNHGKRTLIFSDGQTIQSNFVKNIYSGAFFGDLRQQSVGAIKFSDKQNQLDCVIEFGKVKKMPSDYFVGEIKCKGKVVDQVTGSSMSHLDIGKQRYFDARNVKAFKYYLNKPEILKSVLESDHSLRQDLNVLKTGNLERAQQSKQKLEQLQRRDAKLRQKKGK